MLKSAKSCLLSFVVLVMAMVVIHVPSSMSFTPSPTAGGIRLSSNTSPVSSTTTKSSSSTQLFFFGQPKDDGKPGDYVCPDCGYVFTKGPKAWAELPNDYYCPPCGAPKRRFKKVPKGSASGKVEVKKNWFGK